jgi:hypothetical protein
MKPVITNIAIYALPGLVVGGVLGFFLGSRTMKKQFLEGQRSPTTGEKKVA